MFLINYSTCHEKKQDEIFSPHCPLIESDTLCSKDGGKRHEDKTGLKIHQRDGQISSSGQLAGRNFPPPQLLVSMKGSPFVCQTHAFILSCYFLYTVCTPRTRTLLILTWTSYIPATPFSVPVISLYACQHTYVQAEHTYRHTHSHAYERYKSNPHMNRFHYLLSAPATSLTDVIVSSGGGLSLIEVGVGACVCACVCVCAYNYLSRASPSHGWYCLAYQTSCQVLSLSWLSAALCSCYNNGNVGLWRSHTPEVKPACLHACLVSQQQTPTPDNHVTLTIHMSYSQWPLKTGNHPAQGHFRQTEATKYWSASVQLYRFHLHFFFPLS